MSGRNSRTNPSDVELLRLIRQLPEDVRIDMIGQIRGFLRGLHDVEKAGGKAAGREPDSKVCHRFLRERWIDSEDH